MKGRNTIILNEECVKQALQEYLVRLMPDTPLKVLEFDQKSGTPYSSRELTIEMEVAEPSQEGSKA